MSLRPGPHPVKHGRLAGTSPACIPTATRLSHGNKRGQYFPPQPGFLAGTSAVSISTATRPSRGHKPGQYFHPQPGFLTGTSPVSISTRNPAFSRAQARSAPRAHVRELLCETQSSKEQLRRSRTESSEAPPATEELAGEARQVRPARAACGFISTDFRLLAGGEVWRAPGPPAPPTVIFSRKFEYPPLPRPRPAEVEKFRPGTVSPIRRGLEGIHSSCSPQAIFSFESSLVVFLLQEMELYCSYLLTIDLKKRKKKVYLFQKTISRCQLRKR